ncbi:MAG: VOC family protein [Longimicrobiales bacterium]
MARAKAIPEGFHTLTPYLILRDAAKAIEFYRKAFDATEVSRHADDDGRIRHAEIRIGDSMVMLTEEASEWPEWKSPESRGGTPVHLYAYVEDADAMFARAIAAGATELLPIKDQPYGDRSGGVTDPFGHIWYISTRIEDVTSEEMKRRQEETAKV